MLGPSSLHELHESKLTLVSRIDFFRSKVAFFPAHVTGVCDVYVGGTHPDSRADGRRERRPVYTSRKMEIFERINSIRETKGNFDSCNSCKRLETSRLHELHK